MVGAMVEAIEGGRQRANLRFAHSGTIVPIVTALGLQIFGTAVVPPVWT